MIKDISKEDKPKIKPGCLIVSLGVWGFFIFIIISIIISTRPKTYKSFGDEEIEIIREKFDITIDDSTTPIRMELSNFHGDHTYELWLENINDPESFMENCYNGSYTVIENKSDLIELGEKEIRAIYDYNGSLVAGSSYIMYTRAYDDGYTPKRYNYVIVFYKDGDSFKAKVVDDFWT
ncbi:hypothetical protein [Ruminococcus sp.]|uniref:hypothetical protein n=1 Tax=Ruminococcus sp. TaxID=41978 RepID=UPI00258CC46F|nr:hypothetical protein [Ruminococcus sp.]MCR5022271.1 hypothetical protein [Ruminococcus sp.]